MIDKGKIIGKTCLAAFFMLSNFILQISSVYAELAVMIVADPGIQRIIMDGEVQQILLTARSNQLPVQFAWERTGPGALEGNATEAAITYRLPPALSTPEAEVTVSVTITNEQGETATARHILHLFASTPTPLPDPPTPIPDPPTPLPVKCSTAPRTFDDLNATLSTSLKRYAALKQEEQAGEQRQRQMLEVLEAIVCDLQALENLLTTEYAQTPAIQERIERAHIARQAYEQERRERLNN